MLKNIFITLTFLLFAIGSHSQTIEHGVVKEYCGTKAKQPLPGVEVMVKGAPTSVSDQNGSFALRFATLVAGDKVDYSEIYKDGYVIFNKDALDAWRISNSEKPFTIVMCKESDFRALKKKFYGIIEKSYKAEYEKQKAIAEQSISNELELNTKLSQLKKEYNEKLGNINTYVELFSRIDRSEMDSIEANSLKYIEQGEIDKAISIYEELQISQQVKSQMSKWDSGTAMVSAGNQMIEQVKSDLTTLVEKMLKQIGLYEMGGNEYKEKRKALVEEIIPVLYRLNAISDGQYNETLGMMIIERSKYRRWSDRVSDYREAASLPSITGLSSLGQRLEMMALKNHECSDSARMQYEKILELCHPDDSTAQAVTKRLVFLPRGTFKADDGNVYPFGLWGDNESEAYLCGRSSYVSTHLEGEVKLPDEIIYNGKSYPVTGIAYFAFGNNKSLRKIILPKHLEAVAEEAFAACGNLDTIVAPPRLYQLPLIFNHETIITFPEGCENIDFISSLYNNLANTYPDTKTYARVKQELLKTHGRESAKRNEHEISQLSFRILIFNLLENGDTINALDYAKENVKLNGNRGELTLGYVYQLLKDYDNAFHHYKKGLKTGDAEVYNQMAYVYASPEFKRQDFKKAHEYIDIAIEKSRNDSIKLPDFWDSKGEIFLLEDKEDDAKRVYNDIIAFSPDYYDGKKSVLHTHFSSYESITPPANTIEVKQYDDSTNLQNYIDIAQIVARKEYNLATLENFRSADYEEMLSIAIIAVQVIIKNKTPVQLARHNLAYISTAISWAIRNEMQLRYDWYNIFGTDPSYKSKFAEECKNRNIDAHKLTVNYAIYLNLKDLYHTALDYGYVNTPAFENIRHYWDMFHKAKELMNDEQREFVDFLMSRSSNAEKIETQFNLTTIISSINIIMEVFNANKEPGYGLAAENITATDGNKTAETHTDNSATANIKSSMPLISPNKELQPYFDIVKLVSDNEMRHVERVGLKLDCEELYSIGILAVQVMIKNNTPDKLAKYNSAYIGTAITWAIRNELSIRYPKYSQASKIFEFTTDDPKLSTRMTINFVIKDLCYNPGDLANCEVMQEIKNMMEGINKAKSKLSGSYRECAEFFFSKESTPAEIMKKYSSSQIIEMLDLIKKETSQM